MSIFPLLLISSSVLGFVLRGNPELQDRILASALRQFPVIGDQLGRPEGVRGSAAAIVVGIGYLIVRRRRGGPPGDPATETA